MKTIRSGLSNVLVLVLLAALSVLLIALLSNANSGSATSLRSPLTTPTIASARVSPLSTPNAPSVPLAHIGAPVLLKTADQLSILDNSQGKFINIGGQGPTARTVALDPTTGAIQPVTNTALWNAHVAGHWLVYIDHSALNATPYYSRIKILDLDTKKEILLGDEHALQDDPNISDNIVVWDEYPNGMLSNIYGYDLTTGKKFPIVVKPGMRGHPRISGQWVTYVQWPGKTSTGWEFAIELHAYSLKTNEDILIGLIPSPKDAGWGTQYALDENKIVWDKYLESPGRQSELHLYDLTTHTDRKLLGPEEGWAYDLSISAQSGVIASSGGGGAVLDWRQSEPVYLSFDLPPRAADASIAGFFVSGDHLFWQISLDKENSKIQIFAAPITR